MAAARKEKDQGQAEASSKQQYAVICRHLAVCLGHVS